MDAFSAELAEFGIPSAPRYIKKPAFMCQVIRERKTFGTSGFPFQGPHRQGLPPVEYKEEEYPGTMHALATACVLPWNEFYTEEDVRFLADAVSHVAQALQA